MTAIKSAKNYLIDPFNALEVHHLSCYYQDNAHKRNPIIKDFSFKFAKNQIYCLIGPSGSGKTTLITHFNGLSKSKKGNIFFSNGSKILFYYKKIKDYKKIRKYLSLVFQSPEHQLFKETVLKDVSFGPKVLKLPKKDIIPNSVKTLLDLGISEEFFNSNPFNLSGGQKRKVALAGIFAIDPDVLVFDEPTAGLDPYSEQETINMIKDAKKKGKSVIVITHNMEHVLDIADHVLLLVEGRLVRSDTVHSFFKNYHLIERYNVIMPKTVQMINDMINVNPIWEKLWDYSPRNAQSLADAIVQVIKDNHNQSSIIEQTKQVNIPVN